MNVNTALIFFLLFIQLAIAVGALLWFAPMILCFIIKGAPFVPSTSACVRTMISLANLSGNERVVDLGSGDGRIVIAAVKAGAKSGVGYEIVPGLIFLSRLRARFARVGDRATFRCQSMWKADLSNTNVVFLYQIPYAMQKISDLLRTKLPPGARVISNGFKIPNLYLLKEIDSVRAYRINGIKNGHMDVFDPIERHLMNTSQLAKPNLRSTISIRSSNRSYLLRIATNS